MGVVFRAGDEQVVRGNDNAIGVGQPGNLNYTETVLTPIAGLNEIAAEYRARESDDGGIQNIYAIIFESRKNQLSVTKFDPECGATGILNPECPTLRMDKYPFTLINRTILIKSRFESRKIRRLMEVLFAFKQIEPNNIVPDPATDFKVIGAGHRLPHITFNVPNGKWWSPGNAVAGNRQIILSLACRVFNDLGRVQQSLELFALARRGSNIDGFARHRITYFALTRATLINR